MPGIFLPPDSGHWHMRKKMFFGKKLGKKSGKITDRCRVFGPATACLLRLLCGNLGLGSRGKIHFSIAAYLLYKDFFFGDL